MVRGLFPRTILPSKDPVKSQQVDKDIREQKAKRLEKVRRNLKVNG